MLRDADIRAISMKSLLLRPTRLVAFVLVLVLTLALGALSLFTWLDFKRIESIRSHENRTFLLEESRRILEEVQLRVVMGAPTPDRIQLEAVRSHLAQIPIKGGPVGTYMREHLERLDQLLTQAETQPGNAVRPAVAVLGEMLERENRIQFDLLDTVYADIRLELRLAMAALVGFPAMVLLTLWALRQHVFRPIADLKEFLARLANGDFRAVSVTHIDPLLVPLFQNYNQMVNRLQQLEQANRQRTTSLEQEVHAATQALLQQQQSLSRAERLAAAGEVSATLAHELRNPIAGIQLSLENLRRDVPDAALGERLDMAVVELRRLTRLLNGLLQQSSHVPEPPRMVSVHRLVQELATLIRYQLPPNVRLVTHAPQELSCRIPEDGIRQAVLNLVLNAVAVLGDSPGTVTIDVDYRDGALCVQVLDDGPGFPREMLAGGIRPFVTSREAGTGLGLAIVRRFARDLGGELSIANRPPRGACVTLTLPCAREDARHALAD